MDRLTKSALFLPIKMICLVERTSGFQTLKQGFKAWKARVLEKLGEGKKSEEKT